MADVYCDQSLGTGADNGTSWTDAYRLLETALNSSNVGAGDTLWVKNNNTTSGSVSLDSPVAFTNNPPNVFGVKSATTATPPANSDLIPGLRTGDTTRAYDQTAGNAAPIFKTTVASSSMDWRGRFGVVYGLIIKARKDLLIFNLESIGVMEECEFRAGDGESGEFVFGGQSTAIYFKVRLKNCKLSAGTNGQLTTVGRAGTFPFTGCEIDILSDPMVEPGGAQLEFSGCDLSSQSGAILTDAGGHSANSVVMFNNCKIHASSALVSGSISENFRTEFIGTSSATGKTTGQSFQEIDIITSEGNIVEETTAFRTDGADDGASGAWSLAFTPSINGTRDNYVPLIGPSMAIEVTGDGTAQTVTVYIANSSASTDYQDDEVWLEVKYPSEDGTADYNFATTQMDLLASASNITDDTGSAWGTGANNHQKLSVSISPDYDGFVECRVFFAKNFGASPETLYVDPLPVLS